MTTAQSAGAETQAVALQLSELVLKTGRYVEAAEFSTMTPHEAVRVAGRARGLNLEARTVDWAQAPLPPGIANSPSKASDMRAMWQDYDRHGLRGDSNVLRMPLGRKPASFAAAAAAFAARG